MQMTITEISRLTGASYWQVKYAIQTNGIKTSKRGNKVTVPIETIVAYLNDRNKKTKRTAKATTTTEQKEGE